MTSRSDSYLPGLVMQTSQAGRRTVFDALIYFPLIGATFLGKLAFPPLAERGIGVAFLLVYFALLGFLIANRLRIDSQRAVLFVFLFIPLFLLQLILSEDIGLASMLFFLAIHIPYVFCVDGPQELPRRVLEVFQRIALLMTCLGIGQFVIQFVIDPSLAYPIENFIPSSFLISGYNMQPPIAYGLDVHRANGIFMLEPSFFSQLLAVGVVAEVCTRKRLWVVGLLSAGLLLSYSGTGLVVLAVSLPIAILMGRMWSLLILGIIGLVLLSVSGGILFLDTLFSRFGEFSSQGSSGFARFIGGFFMFDQFLWGDPLRTAIGYGPGAFKVYAAKAMYPVAEMALFKVVLELGLIGAAAYFGFMFFCVLRSSAPLPVRISVCVCLFLGGSYSLFFHGLALSLFAWPSASSACAGRSSEHVKLTKPMLPCNLGPLFPGRPASNGGT
jgi:hypothetical protein